MYTLREYQQQAVDTGLDVFNRGKKNSVLVMPTGSGKSLVIASIAKELEGNTIVLQPSVEILEQNLEKTKNFGFKDVGVFSASAGQKEIGKITFAMIGSIYNKPELWSHFRNIIIDECHLTNAKGGMYAEFIESNGGNVLGLTATPFRLHAYNDLKTGNKVVVAKLLTRTNPKIFNDIAHVTQISELYDKGYLCPVEYYTYDLYDHSDLELNTTGMDFKEESLRAYNQARNIIEVVADTITKLKAKHILVFNVFVEEAEVLSAKLRQLGISSASISSKTKKSDRKRILSEFKSGKIKVVTNVGVLTTGFDFPELDCVILARPTQSVALYYQMVGRGIRTAPHKESFKLVDVCGNVSRFGKVETFQIVRMAHNPNLLRLRSNVGYLTGFDFINNEDVEQRGYKGLKEMDGWTPDVLNFGKYAGLHIAKVPTDYLVWMVGNFTGKKWKERAKEELNRRSG